MAASDYAIRTDEIRTCAEGGVHRWEAEVEVGAESCPLVRHPIKLSLGPHRENEPMSPVGKFTAAFFGVGSTWLIASV
ncbi:MAG: hypothetical protein ACXU8Q_15965, partial [Caulobacteraceae bacterium]